LPVLEEGLAHDSWRIRQASVQLLGDLLTRIIAMNSSEKGDEDTGNVVLRVLGLEHRNTLLASLYMIRFDISAAVRQKSFFVWKNVVINTPKILREILASLMALIIRFLGSPALDKRQLAGRTLGDLVEKLGDKVLPEIIPILEQGLDSDRSETRQGVCLGLSEVISSLGKAQLGNYGEALIPAVRKALCDELPEVREAAAQAFDGLSKSIGNQTLDGIVISLLGQLEDQESHAFDALKQILSVRSNHILPFLLPKLLSPPLSAFNVRALASIAEVAGSSLHPYLSSLVPALIECLVLEGEPARTAAEAVILAIQSEGSHLLIGELIKLLENPMASYRIETSNLIAVYCLRSKANFESQLQSLMHALFQRFLDEVEFVQRAALIALQATRDSIRKENQVKYVAFVNDLLSSMREHLLDRSQTQSSNNLQEDIPVAGLCLPKGLFPLLNILLQGLMYGSVETREQAASGIGELIRLTSEAALKPYLLQIAGPLIRIAGDRFPSEVKASILQALYLLIRKGGIHLKTFLAPLQTTFIRSLSDSSKAVRTSAANALGSLMTIATRIDPLLSELINTVAAASSSSSSSDEGMQESSLSALKMALGHVGNSVSPEIISRLSPLLMKLLDSEEESIRLLAAKSFGIAFKRIIAIFEENRQMPNSLLEDLLRSGSGSGSGSMQSGRWQQRHGSCLALKSLVHQCPNVLWERRLELITFSSKMLGDRVSSVRQASCELIGTMLSVYHGTLEFCLEDDRELVSFLGSSLFDESNEVRLAALSAIKRFTKKFPENMKPFLSLLIPKIMTLIKERTNLPVKLASERALVHLLEIHSNPQTLESYCKSLESAQARNVTDYCKRILNKLSPDSAEETDDSDH